MAQDRMTREDLFLRLEDTIVRYKGHPYYVRVADAYPNIHLYKLTNTRTIAHTVDHRDSDLDDSSPPLGYLNLVTGAVYLKRMSLRQQSQGLRASQLHAIPNMGFSRSMLTGLPMENTILGRYPSFDQALEQLKALPTYASVAISRNVAIGYVGSSMLALYYKTRQVAMKIGTEWSYLQLPDRKIIQKLIEDEGVVK